MKGRNFFTVTLPVLLIVAMSIACLVGIFVGNRQSKEAEKDCLRAGYDGYKTIESQPFCYQVLDNGQIEYLRYEYASE